MLVSDLEPTWDLPMYINPMILDTRHTSQDQPVRMAKTNFRCLGRTRGADLKISQPFTFNE